MKIKNLYGVYDADATVIGEISYWLGARIGIRHCSLCDITHFLFREKVAWQNCQSELLNKHGVNFQAFHRNDQPEQVRKVINGKYPAVVAQDTAGNFSLFMDDRVISSCGSSPAQFMIEIIKCLPEALTGK